MENIDKELILLKIRNAIANKEAEIATANMETSVGGAWLCDHMEGVRYFENEIQDLTALYEEVKNA